MGSCSTNANYLCMADGPVHFMERKILDIKWQDHVPNKTVKERSKFSELMTIIMRQKWKWAGHVSRMTDNWARDLTM